MEQKMLTVPGLAVRNLRHRRVRTMFLAALVLILSAALFTSRVLTESMKTCIDKTVDRIGADVIVAPGEYESDLSDSLFSGGLQPLSPLATTILLSAPMCLPVI